MHSPRGNKKKPFEEDSEVAPATDFYSAVDWNQPPSRKKKRINL